MPCDACDDGQQSYCARAIRALLHPLVQVFEFPGGCSASKRLDPKLEHGINVDDSDNGSKHYPLTQSVSAVKRSSSRFLDAPLLPPSVDIPGRDSPSIHSL